MCLGDRGLSSALSELLLYLLTCWIVALEQEGSADLIAILQMEKLGKTREGRTLPSRLASKSGQTGPGASDPQESNVGPRGPPKARWNLWHRDSQRPALEWTAGSDPAFPSPLCQSSALWALAWSENSSSSLLSAEHRLSLLC